MKCDELQYEHLGDANKTYPASTLVIRKQFVDAAIDELKAENENIDYHRKQLSRCCSIKENEIKELINKIHDLKVIISQKEDAINEAVDKAFNIKKERDSTKRALWLARAERALSDFAWHQYTAETLLRGGTSAAVDYQKWKAKKWKNVERLCRAKAEEYK